MGIALMFLLALYQMQSAIHSEIIETNSFNDNALLDTVDDPSLNLNTNPNTNTNNELLDALVQEKPEQTELEFRYPISAIGIDYAKNSVVLRFQKNARKQRFKYDPDYEMKRKSMQDNFMHFGKRQAEQLPPASGNGYYDAVKRGGGMDRYGRDPKQDFMRFGRSPASSDFMRFGRAPSDFMRFGRDPKQDFMRFGRSDNFMRLGRNMQLHEELRSPKQDFMRFGRPDNFMRFGRSTPTEFERFGKMDANFMRFGKSLHGAGEGSTEANQTKSQAKSGEQSNTVDKDINMLFTKQHDLQQSKPSQEGTKNSSEQTEEGSVEQQFYGP